MRCNIYICQSPDLIVKRSNILIFVLCTYCMSHVYSRLCSYVPCRTGYGVKEPLACSLLTTGPQVGRYAVVPRGYVDY